jgi:hypothetical protein
MKQLNSQKRILPRNVQYALFQKLSGGAGSKRYGMDFSRSHEGKEENPRNYNDFCNRERKNTFHITLNQRLLLSFGTVCAMSQKCGRFS